VKKFFVTLGVVFLGLLVLGGIGVGYFVYRANALDKESQTYVNAAINAIVPNWNKKELLDRASPEFKKAITDAQIDQLFHRFTVLGRFMTSDSAEGQASILATPQTGKIVTAEYKAKAYFEKGGATINVKLIQHDEHWQILRLDIVSPQLGAVASDSIASLTALDKESKTYADDAIRAIVSKWDEKELSKRASPEFKQAVTAQQLDQLFNGFRGFGHLKKCEPAEGRAGMSPTTQAGEQARAEYYAKATFDKGSAVVDMALIKHGDQWQILGFFVRPPDFATK